MKKLISFILTIIIVIAFGCMALGCGGSSGSSSSSYDRDADYVADQFGVDSGYVKDSVEAMAGAIN